MVFSYDLEDTDKTTPDKANSEDSDSANVFNGQYSVLWCNVRDGFADEIRQMYIALRSNNEKPFSYNSIQQKMEKHQETWPEALWNEDSYFKYIESFLSGKGNYLAMLQGNKASQRDWWLYYGFKYRDSKYRTGEAQSTFITLRLYDNEEKPMTITPYSNIHVWAKFGSYEEFIRGKANEPVELTVPAINFNDTECYIYSADCISDLGDLSGFKIGLVDISAATKLQSIIIGSSAEGYVNNNFYNLDVGTNDLLSLVNIENCVIDYSKHANEGTIDLSNCHGLETFNGFGSNIKAITLSNGGHLKTLELPSTLTSFTIQNQKYFESITLEGYDNITVLNLENTPNLPVEDFLLKPNKLLRVRLKNVEWTVSSQAKLETIFDLLKTVDGYDDNGNEVAGARVSGKVHIDSIDDELIAEINTIFPELVIVANGNPRYYIRYINLDNTLLYSYIAEHQTAAIDPVALNYISTPTFEDELDIIYTYKGWENLPTSIEKPYTLLVDYEDQYLVKYYINKTDSEPTYETWVIEKTAAPDPVDEGKIETPTKESSAQYSYTFSGWSPSLENITEPTSLYVTFLETVNNYRVHFKSQGRLLQEHTVAYGSSVFYEGDPATIPYYIYYEEEDSENNITSDLYEWEKWDRSLEIKPSNYTEEPIIINAIFTFNGNLNDISWEEIAANAATGVEENYYGLGSQKDVSVTLSDGNTYTVTMELVAKNFDLLTSPSTDYNNNSSRATYTFLALNPEWTRPFNNSINDRTFTDPDTGETFKGATAGGWTNSDIRAWSNGDFLTALLAENEGLEQAIKSVEKISDRGTDNSIIPSAQVEPKLLTTQDKIWIPSITELNLSPLDDTVIYGQQSSMVDEEGNYIGYPWFITDESRIKELNDNPVVYWTRTHSPGLIYIFYKVKTAGNILRPQDDGNVSNPLGFVFGFCI